MTKFVHLDDVKQLCNDFSSRTGNVYIKDVESCLDHFSVDLEAPKFPVMLRKMWSGPEIQDWIDTHWQEAINDKYRALETSCPESSQLTATSTFTELPIPSLPSPATPKPYSVDDLLA